MKAVHPSPLLKFALLVDAAVSGAMGVLQLSAATALAALLDLPQPLLLGTGEFFVVYALLLVGMATRARLWSALVMLIVVGNGLWGLACVALLAAGALAPNALGVGFVLMQAVAVSVFAWLEWRGLRSSAPASDASRAALS
ncbi:MAG: hypothetical protein AD742_19430 [Methylibium sp. NZG]|nr:MAG: hypothetical protein AD742_19430 [Methylibium sp. NZG]